jgi:putative colanic acid biosynthesis acetyltransferase WcaF
MSAEQTPNNLPPAQTARIESEWSTRQKLHRLFWAMVRNTLFRYSFHNWYGIRSALLRAFGAKVGKNVRIRRSVNVEIPSNLEIGDGVVVGDFAILYALGPIRIGDRTLISQYAHLCAGSHDYRLPNYPLLRPPITVGQDCWIAADAFIGPGVTIGDRTVIGARSSVFSNVPADVVAGGNPARVIKPRQLNA